MMVRLFTSTQCDMGNTDVSTDIIQIPVHVLHYAWLSYLNNLQYFKNDDPWHNEFENRMFCWCTSSYYFLVKSFASMVLLSTKYGMFNNLLSTKDSTCYLLKISLYRLAVTEGSTSLTMLPISWKYHFTDLLSAKDNHIFKTYFLLKISLCRLAIEDSTL